MTREKQECTGKERPSFITLSRMNSLLSYASSADFARIGFGGYMKFRECIDGFCVVLVGARMS